MAARSAEKRLRLGILDAVPFDFRPPEEKSDADKFIDMFTAIDAPLAFVTYEATEGQLPAALDDCDAYLITGSPCSVYDRYEWIPPLERFIGSAFAHAKPLVGICFGHQLIAQSLGGTVSLAPRGWLLGLHDIELRHTKHWMQDAGAAHPLYFINQDQVVDLPPDVEHLAGSGACPNAMFSVDNRLLSLQAHPEQPLSSMHTFSNILLDKYGIDRSIYDAALRTMAAGEPDASVVATWISNFLCAASDADGQ